MGQIFKSGPSKICGRQSLKNFTWSTLEYFVPFIPTKYRKMLDLQSVIDSNKKPGERVKENCT